MVKVFSGKDQYESYIRAKNEALKIAKDSNSALKIINADEIDSLETFIQDLEGIGMFSESSVYFIKRLSGNKKAETYFQENYDRLKNQEIIIWEESVDGRNKFTQMLKKEGVLFIFEEVKDKDLKKWLTDQLKNQNLNLSTSDIDFLIQNLEQDKFVIKTEIKKMKLYMEYKKKNSITHEEVNEILGFNIKGNIWKFLDYFGERQRKKCLHEYIKLTAFEDNTQYLIAMIERELSILSQIKYSESNGLDLRDLKLHPFVLQKSQAKARNFKWSELKFFLIKLLNLDYAIKRGDINEKLGMTLYLLSL